MKFKYSFCVQKQRADEELAISAQNYFAHITTPMCN